MKLVLLLPLFAFFAQYLRILNPSSPVVLLTLFLQDVVVSCREPSKKRILLSVYHFGTGP